MKNYIESIIFGCIFGFSCLCLYSSYKLIKDNVKNEAIELYERGYIEGFRYARHYEIKDTAELNHLYPNMYYLDKYAHIDKTKEETK